ncbi:dihydroneopterin aldolase [Chitinophaga pinensis]|uniref:dihydroneopterin aldolase n=1 Tax=Chitinophaga pinensis (strain ATCC 43595 / DSM 2588 / LMG 13176 / NBRC 15968 / NCIMB 11800 / UQM 2034) TaxID=485918 RepID=A0A979GA80_CHIPD|nr:dihydroneopterin aldolase [Chitinophaga pinensis]ACU63641.1 dihydroneopterin aldolase [Chitinophaga pinensis DSM 2588]
MLTVGLEQATFRAFHGLYPEERVIGNEFVVDIFVTIPGTHHIDSIAETVNYQGLYNIVKKIMAVPQPLLEQVVYNISGAVKEKYPEIQRSVISLKKMNPPMGAPIRNSIVTLEKNY